MIKPTCVSTGQALLVIGHQASFAGPPLPCSTLCTERMQQWGVAVVHLLLPAPLKRSCCW